MRKGSFEGSFQISFRQLSDLFSAQPLCLSAMASGLPASTTQARPDCCRLWQHLPLSDNLLHPSHRANPATSTAPGAGENVTSSSLSPLVQCRAARGPGSTKHSFPTRNKEPCSLPSSSSVLPFPSQLGNLPNCHQDLT